MKKTQSEESHRGACRAHAQARAKERLNINLSIDDVYCMSNLVNTGKSVPCKNNRHLLRYGDKIYMVIFDPDLHTIKTILDDDAAKSALVSQLRPEDYHKLGK